MFLLAVFFKLLPERMVGQAHSALVVVGVIEKKNIGSTDTLSGTNLQFPQPSTQGRVDVTRT